MLKSRFWIFGARDLQEPLDVPIAAFDVCLTPSLPLAGRDMLASADKLLAGAQAVVSSPTFSLENQFDMPVSDDQVRATAVSLCVEGVILTIVGVLSPALPDTVAVSAIAFAATMQSSGFQRVGKWTYTSVVTTANLRSLGETLFAITFLPHDPEASDRARTLAAICAFFVCSAIAGATLTVFYGKSAIVFPIILLSLAALSFVWQEHGRAKTGSS